MQARMLPGAWTNAPRQEGGDEALLVWDACRLILRVLGAPPWGHVLASPAALPTGSLVL